MTGCALGILDSCSFHFHVLPRFRVMEFALCMILSDNRTKRLLPRAQSQDGEIPRNRAVCFSKDLFYDTHGERKSL